MRTEGILSEKLDRRSVLRRGRNLVAAFALLQLPSATFAQELPPTSVISLWNQLDIHNIAQIPTTELEEVARAASFSLDYFKDLGLEFSSTNSIIVVRSGRNSAVQGQNMLFNPDGSAWVSGNRISRDREMTHEVSHLFQNQLAGMQALNSSPRWLVEGSAEVFADDALLRSGQITNERIRGQMKTNYLDVESSFPELQALEAPPSIPGAYGLYSFATRRLIAANGMNSLINFYRSLKGTDGEWSVQFQSAFGISPGNYYNEFKKIREQKSID